MVSKYDLHAFPITEDNYPHDSGLTMRDYFAAKALAGDFAAQSTEVGEISNGISDEWMLDRAKMFYRMADAMIAAR